MKRLYWFALLLILLKQSNAQEDYYFQWAKQMEIMSSLSEKLLNNYIEKPNPEILMNDAIKGMLSETDRFTHYYTEQQMFDQRLRNMGKFSGIGVMVNNHRKGLAVIRVLPGSPAEKAGLKTGDIIRSTDGKRLDSLSYSAKKKLLSGKPGSEIELKLLRRGKTLTVKVKRAVIPQKTVPYYAMLDKTTGYIKLLRFSKNAGKEVQEAVVDLKNRGAKKLILDLRGNPGGLLNQALYVAGLFLPTGTLVVKTKGRFEKFDKEYHTKNTPMDTEMPLAVLINGNSASASEIVSGTLQEYDRAVIVGDTSYGKGLVQRFFPLKYGTYVKITISKYYLPSGRLIQKIDYWHRDAKGKPGLFRTKHEKTFYTKHKRKVYEHGGIAPDIISKNEYAPIVKAIANQNYIFDFNTEYYYTHDKPENPGTLAGEDLVPDLVKYLQKNRLDPETTFEKKLEKNIRLAEKENIPSGLLENLRQVSARLDKEQLDTLLNNAGIRHQLNRLIISDLMLRYFGPEAQYQWLLRDDETVKKALEILGDEKRYGEVLDKGE